MKTIVILSCLALCGFSASAQASDFIILGNGGGFTGNVTEYKITSTGKVFKGSGIAEIKYTECAKLKKSKAKQIVAEAHGKLKILSPFNYPGNTYSYLTVVTQAKEETITWGDVDHPVPDDVTKFFGQVQKAVKDLRYKPIK